MKVRWSQSLGEAETQVMEAQTATCRQGRLKMKDGHAATFTWKTGAEAGRGGKTRGSLIFGTRFMSVPACRQFDPSKDHLLLKITLMGFNRLQWKDS